MSTDLDKPISLPSSRGGVDAPSTKCSEATFEGADGVVRHKTFSDHPVCARLRRLRDIFLMGAATPPLEEGSAEACSGSGSGHKHRRDAGFSLAALIFFATAASILLAAAVPAYQQQARREREQELIFRGEEYTRAIQKYQRKFMIYPPSIDALLETNGLRFLRRAYKDPITDKEFRLITLNSDGSVVGSTLFNQRINNAPVFGGNPAPFGSTPGTGSTSPATSGSPPRTPQTGNAATPAAGRPNTPGTSTNPAVGFGSSIGTPPNPNPIGGNAGVIGVASNSEESSIKVYNNRQKYNEWEFIAILGQPGANPTQPGNAGNPPGSTPGNGPGATGNTPGAFGNTPGSFGNPPPQPGNTPGSFGNTPGSFGTPPGQSNPGAGRQPSPAPFGFGNTQQGQPQQPIKRP